jgi:hypothetical protein
MPAVGALVRSTNGMWIARRLRPRWIALAIHNFHNSGNTTTMRGPLRCSPKSPPQSPTLREFLVEQTFESLARRGAAMTAAAMATYAYDQIDQARAELNAVSK